jgi:hypothetical protein
MNVHLMQEISKHEEVVVISSDFERINMPLTGVRDCCKLTYVNAWMKALFPTTYDRGGEIVAVLHFAVNRLEALVLSTINIQASLFRLAMCHAQVVEKTDMHGNSKKACAC